MDWKDSEMVSVIITCHNYGRYLRKALESVFDQLYGNIEVIVINDGSKDNTSDIMGEYASRVKVVHNPSPRGCGVARDQGIEIARGKFCLFLDADDYLDPYFLVKTVPLILQPGIGVVYCSFWQVFHNKRVMIQTLPYRRREMLRGNLMAITSLTRTELVKKVGGLDNRLLLQDYDLWMRITQIANGVGVMEPLFYQTMHGDNMNLTMPQARRTGELNRIRQRIGYGIFMGYRGQTHLITGTLLRHEIPRALIYDLGLDEDDLFEVTGEVLAGYQEGRKLESLEAIKQSASNENRW